MLILYRQKQGYYWYTLRTGRKMPWHLRISPENSATPILLAISRYEIPQGNAVKEMGNAAFIMTPFGEKELRNKVHDLLEKS